MNFPYPITLAVRGTILLAAMLAVASCSDKKKAAEAPSNASASASVTPASDNLGGNAADEVGPAASEDYVDERIDDSDRRHRQEMDHSDMRMGRMPGGDQQQRDTQPPPMTDM